MILLYTYFTKPLSTTHCILNQIVLLDLLLLGQDSIDIAHTEYLYLTSETGAPVSLNRHRYPKNMIIVSQFIYPAARQFVTRSIQCRTLPISPSSLLIPVSKHNIPETPIPISRICGATTPPPSHTERRATGVTPASHRLLHHSRLPAIQSAFNLAALLLREAGLLSTYVVHICWPRGALK
jgi:hypothetical protein